jgi:hypothetical protein
MASVHRTALVTFALASSLTAGAQGQQPVDPELAVIEGTVLNIQNSRTIPRAVVSLRQVRAGQQSKSTRADGSGHFIFRNVDPGAYRLAAERQGFFSDDRKREYQPVVEVSAGEYVKNVPVRLMPSAVLAGEVVDEFNDPVQEVEVTALAVRVRLGQIYLTQAGKMTTDDRGQYRIAGLHPGKYYLVAEYKNKSLTDLAVATQTLNVMQQVNTDKRGNPIKMEIVPETPDPAYTYAPLFYPATNDFLQAQTLTLNPGDEFAANFLLISASVVSIRGRVINGMTGALAGTASVFAFWTPYMEGDGVPARVSPQDATFEVRGLAPGTYTLRATATDQGESYTGEQTVEVGNQGAQNVQIAVLPDFAAAGHVTITGTIRNPMGRVVIEFAGEGLTPRLLTSARAPEYKFDAQIRPDRRYRAIIRNLQDDYYLKSVALSGHDVPPDNIVVSGRRGEIEMVLSPSGGRIEGFLFDTKDQPTRGSVLLVPNVPEPGPPDLFQRASADAKGKFIFRGVVPGSYRLLALESVNLGAEINSPDFARTIGNRGQGLIVDENGRYAISLKLDAENR